MGIPLLLFSRQQRKQKTYIDKVKELNPLAFWPLNEASGSTAYDRSGNGYNGAYTGVTLGQPGQGGQTCPLFDGANDFVNVYSAGLAGAINTAEGSAAGWVKVYDVGTWSDSTYRYLIDFGGDVNNYINISKTSNASQLDYIYRANGTTKEIAPNPSSSLLWLHLALTWSKSADEVKAYLSGTQRGSTQTGLGTWNAAAINEITIGSVNTTPQNVWYGWLQYVGLWARALTATEVARLAVMG